MFDSLLNSLMTKVNYLREGERTSVQSAFRLANEIHHDHFRLDGTLYIEHLLGVAEILAEWGAPKEIVIAGLLHDISKSKSKDISTETRKIRIKSEFGNYIYSLINQMETLSSVGPKIFMRVPRDETNTNIEINRNSWLAVKLRENPIAAIIKIADRLQNSKSVGDIPLDHQKRFCDAVKFIYGPFADRLGMYSAKCELQDVYLRIERPDDYLKASNVYDEFATDQRITQLITSMENLLWQKGVRVKVRKQLLSRYEIYRRTIRYGNRPLPTSAVLAVKLITETKDDCYRALGVLHECYTPLNEFWDYIAKPKMNGYRAIHSKVKDNTLGPFLTIILDEKMNVVAENGIAAEWKGIDTSYVLQLEPLAPCPDGYISAIARNGEVIHLPNGSIALDLAYAVHREVGDRAIKAVVNGAVEDLTYVLNDGDYVDVLRSPGNHGGVTRPADEKVITERARSAIAKRNRKKTNLELYISGWDRIGIVNDISSIISNKAINMIYFHADSLIDGSASIRIGFERVDIQDIDLLIDELKTAFGVKIERRSLEPPPTAPKASISVASRPSAGNPYTLSPVSGFDFKGRKPEIETLLRDLQREKSSIIVWGQERIGKTSLLFHLQRHIFQGERCIPVYVSMRKVWRKSAYNFLHYLIKTIQERFLAEEISLPDPYKLRKNPIHHFDIFLDMIRQSNKVDELIIMIDEFQGISHLAEDIIEKENLLKYLTDLGLADRVVKVIFSASGVYGNFSSNPSVGRFLSSVNDIRLGVLNSDDAKKLITETNQNVQYDDETIAYLLRLTNCHPFYLQILCRKLYAKSSQHLKLHDVAAFIENEFIYDINLEGYLDHYFILGYPDAHDEKKRRAILSSVAENMTHDDWVSFDLIEKKTNLQSDELASVLNDLTDYGSLEKRQMNYRIPLPLLTTWIRSNLDSAYLSKSLMVRG